jgi:hypothetical protein
MNQNEGVWKQQRTLFAVSNGKLVASTDPQKEKLLHQIRKLDHLLNQTNQSNGKSY